MFLQIASKFEYVQLVGHIFHVLYFTLCLRPVFSMSDGEGETQVEEEPFDRELEAKKARALLDKLATVPLAELESSELVDQILELDAFIGDVSECPSITRDIKIPACSRVRLSFFS